MQVISLFSGIGGFELAAEQMGWENIVSCEINPFGRKVLEYYWPQAYHHDDIKTLTYEKINEELTKRKGSEWRSDDIILTGGFPCQPYSLAGKRLGKNDDRHLWPEMLRIIREVKPTWIVGENVFGIVNWNGGLVFDEVQTDLEAQGYEVQSYVLPACAVNAPHRRDRVWFVAYATGNGHKNGCEETRREEQCSEQWRMQQFKGMGWERTTPHPTSERLCGNGAAEQSQLEALRTRNGMGENAPHPNSNSTGTPGKSTSIEGIGGNNNVQQGEWRSKTELNNRPSSVSRDAPHSNGNGFNGGDCEHEVNASERGEYAQRNFEQVGRDAAYAGSQQLQERAQENIPENRKENGTRMDNRTERQSNTWDAADTNGIGLRRESNGFGESRFIGKNEPPAYWQNFPTVSPLCSRNDEFSYRLDSITFSKWRNESIKAAGNAIVPAVVLQIFKAIEAYNNLTNGE